MRRWTFVALALAVVITACGDDDTGASTTSTVVTTTTATLPTTTTTPPATTTTSTTTTTTTTQPPSTTTTTLPPAPVEGWEGEGPRDISLGFTRDSIGIDEIVRRAVRSIGITVVPGADVVLEVDVGLTAYYIDCESGRCFGGSAAEGTVALRDETGANPTLTFQIDGEFAPPPILITGCRPATADDAPFDYAFEPDFIAAMAAMWGEATVPYLAEVMAYDHYVVAVRIAAVQAVRLMDWDAIPALDQFMFLDGALRFAAEIVHLRDIDEARIYRQAVEHLFDEALDWQLEIPVSGDRNADALGIRAAVRQLELRYGH